MLPQRGQGIGVESTEAQYSTSAEKNILLHLVHLKTVVPLIIVHGFICCENSLFENHLFIILSYFKRVLNTG